MGKPRKLIILNRREFATTFVTTATWVSLRLVWKPPAVAASNWPKKGGSEKWHQHFYSPSSLLPSNKTMISNHLYVALSVNRAHNVQHQPRDSALVGGRLGHLSHRIFGFVRFVHYNIFMLSRSAASTAQPEPPLPIDALTMLKKDIPACQKHPAGSN